MTSGRRECWAVIGWQESLLASDWPRGRLGIQNESSIGPILSSPRQNSLSYQTPDGRDVLPDAPVFHAHTAHTPVKMADQEMEGQDFTEDCSGGDFQGNGMENGEGMAVTEAGKKDSGAADAPGRDDDRKLFVGGLSWETQEKELREHFSKFGEIESINVKTDPNTGRSRGFAFIVFSNIEAIDKVINEANHVINGKKVDPKKAKARHGKIFVGGLKPDLSDDDIKNYFGKFGSIVEVELPFDKQKNQRKGFCFITFEQEAVVTELLKTPKQKINGHEVDVKKATPKPDAMGMMRGGMRGAIRGTRGAAVRGRGRGWSGAWNQGGYGGYGQGGYGGGQGYDGKSQRGRQQTRHQPY
ncbi:RNA-binding protein squid-like isoform X9 [Portunus trituberculatus]|uniref:RNA-binding protein squid-like isoform X9 n=1 Tax=Portunus trituberculatus TaxID=210409 RepID=UPI001E1CB24D|nr:RNA-binding protein squid-like isoform X9 [Portunus trituberculatus]